jgi:hypothetical protein
VALVEGGLAAVGALEVGAAWGEVGFGGPVGVASFGASGGEVAMDEGFLA